MVRTCETEPWAQVWQAAMLMEAAHSGAGNGQGETAHCIGRNELTTGTQSGAEGPPVAGGAAAQPTAHLPHERGAPPSLSAAVAVKETADRETADKETADKMGHAEDGAPAGPAAAAEPPAGPEAAAAPSSGDAERRQSLPLPATQPPGGSSPILAAPPSRWLAAGERPGGSLPAEPPPPAGSGPGLSFEELAAPYPELLAAARRSWVATVSDVHISEFHRQVGRRSVVAELFSLCLRF